MSAEHESAKVKGRAELARRVAWFGAGITALVGILAAALAGLIARGLVVYHGDAMVRAAARDLAEEILEELEDDDNDSDEGLTYDEHGRPTLESVVAHELEDVKLPDATALIVRPGAPSVGDKSLPLLEPGSCETLQLAGRERRVCATEFEREPARLVLAVSAQNEGQVWNLIAFALGTGALIGAAIGGVMSYRGASWALSPLTRLRDRVRKIDPERPDAQLLAPPSRHAEIEELRTALVELVERLGASLAQAQAFSAQAAHELRTPLALIAGELELMAEANTLDQRALARARAELQGLTALVQRLLVLATPGRLALEAGEAVDLSDVADSVLSTMSEDKRQRIDVACQDDVVVRGDANLLASLLGNALDNALKFSTEKVKVNIAAQGSEAWLEVADRGPGVAKLERDKVFAPFYRSVQAHAPKTQGYGIGLALIAHVAHAHGGRAEFVDVPEGALLRVKLPLWTSLDAS